MVRIILAAVIFAAFLFALMVPHGYFRPNWEAAYAKADAADDCDAMKRILAGVYFSGGYEWMGKKVELESAERCGYEKNPEAFEYFEKNPRYFEDASKSGPGDTSYYAKIKLLYRFVWQRRKDTRFRLTNEIAHLIFTCQTAGNSSGHQYLDFTPLRYALKHTHLGEDDVLRFVHAKDNYCASLAMRLAQRIETLNPNEKYSRTAIDFWWLSEMINPNSPSLQFQSIMHGREFRDWWDAAYEKAIADGREEEFLRADRFGFMPEADKLNIRWAEYDLDHYAETCDFEAQPIAHPILSLECADRMLKQRADFDPGTKSFHAAFAEYHIRRAERLGALDINALRQRRGALPPACMDAVINAEEADFLAIEDVQTQHPYFRDDDAMAFMETECRTVSE